MPCPEPTPKFKPLNCDENKNKFPFVEVYGPDKAVKRFAPGTRASYAVERFNKKLVDSLKPVVCVEAFKEGEESVEFGPDAPLISMCSWDLRVVQEAPFEPIGPGQKVPNGELSYLDGDGRLQAHVIHDLIRDKRVVFFGVPGAFTPTCSLKHVPGFLELGQEIMERGVKEIICVTGVGEDLPRAKLVKFLCDGSAEWTKKIGLELDLVERGMGVRSRRYCLLVDNTVVKIANIEVGGGLELSTAERILQDLKGNSLDQKSGPTTSHSIKI